ncbi:MAG: fibronectin type III domain-containing protein, partial [Patescibacteria group bacterium]
ATLTSDATRSVASPDLQFLAVTQNSSTDTQSPTTPTNLVATASGTQISLSWAAATDNIGVTGYQILRSTTSGSGYSQIATATNNYYTNTSLSYSTTYYYVVRAYDAAGNVSANSSQAQATTGAAPVVGSGPNISGLSSGTLTDGQSYTISGSGFGSKTTVAPYIWDSVDNQSYNSVSEGALVPTGSGYTWQYNYTTYADGVRLTKNRSNRGIRTAHYYANVDGYLTGRDDMAGGNADKFYATWWVKTNKNIVCGSGGLCASTKLIRVWEDGDGNHGRLSWTGNQFTLGPGNGLSDLPSSWAGWGGVNDQWNRLEIMIDNSNGLVRAYTNGQLIHNFNNWSPQGHYLNRIWRIGLDPSVPSNLDQDLIFEFGEIYVDNTQARVEVCTGSTWSSKGQCEIQIPRTTWNDSQIQFTANRGAFTAGQSVYLYVVDSSGNVNSSGYPAQIGSVLGDSIANCDNPDADTLNWTSLPENILVRGCGSAIYAIENRQRLYIPSLEILRRDYPGQRIYNVSEALLEIYPIVYR